MGTLKPVGFVLVHKEFGHGHIGEVVQSQGSAKLYLTEAAARGARTNMFGHDHEFWTLPLKERKAAAHFKAAKAADIVPVYAKVK